VSVKVPLNSPEYFPDQVPVSPAGATGPTVVGADLAVVEVTAGALVPGRMIVDGDAAGAVVVVVVAVLAELLHPTAKPAARARTTTKRSMSDGNPPPDRQKVGWSGYSPEQQDHPTLTSTVQPRAEIAQTLGNFSATSRRR
jgi:hypothetical protein